MTIAEKIQEQTTPNFTKQQIAKWFKISRMALHKRMEKNSFTPKQQKILKKRGVLV